MSIAGGPFGRRLVLTAITLVAGLVSLAPITGMPNGDPIVVESSQFPGDITYYHLGNLWWSDYEYEATTDILKIGLQGKWISGGACCGGPGTWYIGWQIYYDSGHEVGPGSYMTWESGSDPGEVEQGDTMEATFWANTGHTYETFDNEVEIDSSTSWVLGGSVAAWEMRFEPGGVDEKCHGSFKHPTYDEYVSGEFEYCTNF